MAVVFSDVAGPISDSRVGIASSVRDTGNTGIGGFDKTSEDTGAFGGAIRICAFRAEAGWAGFSATGVASFGVEAGWAGFCVTGVASFGVEAGWAGFCVTGVASFGVE